MKLMKKEMTQFAKDLELWGNGWVDEVKQVVVEHFDELYNDEAIRYIARKYAEVVETRKVFEKDWLVRAYETEMEVKTYSPNNPYTEVLYELCYRRYVKK